MTKSKSKYALVSRRALAARVNRSLRPTRSLKSHRVGGWAHASYVVLDNTRDEIIERISRDDLAEYASKLGVLRDWERLE